MQDFRISPNYRGQRNIIVPVKMYNKHSFLRKVGISSKRWLGVNLDKCVLSFQKDKLIHDPLDEVFFWQIRSVDADMSQSSRSRYFLNITTLDRIFGFKFRNVADFYNVVEALRHTLQNNQPFCVTSDDYTKLVGLHQQSILAEPTQVSRLSTMDFSEDEFDQTNRMNKHTHKTITTRDTSPNQARNIFNPAQSSYQQSQIIPPQQVSLVSQQNQYQTYRNVSSPVNTREVRTVQNDQFSNAFNIPAQSFGVLMSPQIETRTSRTTETRFADQPTSPLYSPANRVSQFTTSPHIHSPQTFPAPLPSMPIHTASLHSPITILRGSGFSDRQLHTTTTVVPPPPAMLPCGGRFVEADWCLMERRLAEEERVLAMRQEEVRQREAILHMQKINAKRAEIDARNDVLREKEFELSGIEQEIRGIQTEIGQVKTSQVVDRLRKSDHQIEIENARRVTYFPFFNTVPGEIVEVSTKEVKTVTEEHVPAAPLFASQTQAYNSGYTRY